MFEPTVNQRRVLEMQNKNILVSASAGTGKTSVMIEKIAGLVMSKKATLKQLLVVTFTDMAAYEMKKRLISTLSASQDRDVLDQLGQIDACAISTLHGFCSNLVRRYFVEAETDPNFKILCDKEWTIAFNKTMGDLFEERYAAGDEKFLRLVEIFGRGRSDGGLKDVISALYNFMVCKADFEDWLKDLADKYALHDGENFFTRHFNRQLALKMEDFRARLDKLAVSAKIFGPEKTRDLAALQAGSIFVSRNKTLRANVAELKDMPPFNAYAPKKSDKFSADQLKNIEAHKQLCAEIKSFLDENAMLTNRTYDELLADMRSSFVTVCDLFDMAKLFRQSFDEVKKKNACLDFSDLEHKALKALSDGRVRAEVKRNYKFVFVDEYQDINEIQEKIISLVKGNDNLFMVGDVKQSIYGFRQCAPDIFVGKIESFQQQTDVNHVEFLNDNYRSNNAILQFVNQVFIRCMRADKGIDYANTSLFVGKKRVGSPLPAVCVDVVRTEKEKVTADKPYCVRQTFAAKFGGIHAEARVIAQRIREVIGLKIAEGESTRTITYSDIAILTRNFTAHTKGLVRELQALGIPLVYTSGKDLFDATEFKTIVNLLRVIDNEQQDIALFGCLTGWFCGMDENQVADVCLFSGGSLWDRITAYAKAKDDAAAQKINKFLAFLEKFRFFAKSMTVSRLIAKIFDETDLSLWILGLPDGDVRLKRINAFSDGLQGKEHNGTAAEFLRYIDSLDSLEAESASSSQTNAVRLMTIHKSKGLEFPIVFLVNCGGKFNFDDKNTVICDKTGGAACMAYDLENRMSHETLSRKYAKQAVVAREQEEEKRLLYVAMTRAQYHLYLTGSATVKRPFGKSEGCYFDWIIPAIYAMGSKNNEEVVFNDQLYKSSDRENAKTAQRKAVFTAFDEQEVSRLKKDLTWSYPHKEATALELKAVSSALQPHFAPQEDEDEALPRVVNLDDVPQTEIGTGYHKVFESINFADKTLQNAEDTIARLCAEGKISAEVAAKIDPQRVLGVISNEIFADLQNKKVYRELPFMLKTQYNNLFDDKTVDENIFLQGVLDMLIMEGNKAAVVDYKFTRTKDHAVLRQRYQKQLDSYAQAVRQILHIDDVRKFIISVADGSVIEL